eukprot:CAMPEP_0174259836 /NCGR_PEP_ID=MMETSP0439-20130205/8613_1 /TAXON_ID=0 /ORGANISM="Stereomyxa ramosa, Strain Chinc5" /LENGTH=210 /DNA_ID=CAMNT_0015343895 /DNA_START=33 /DNA_END=665 /DNA_ORIENTATION=+
MVKHNNVVPNSHFHKQWQRRVKTWFDQPGRKKTRRNKRAAKAAKIFPRPLQKLRPLVRCPTQRYNMKLRLGRGFTLEELKEAGINWREAPGIGIAVDKRRRNKSEQSIRTNVQRLKQYKANLIVFPRRKGHPKPADSSPEECALAEQQRGVVMPYVKPRIRGEARPAEEVDKVTSQWVRLRRARADVRLVGRRKRRAEIEAEKAKLTKRN